MQGFAQNILNLLHHHQNSRGATTVACKTVPAIMVMMPKMQMVILVALCSRRQP